MKGLDVLFVSGKGSQYRYFNKIVANTRIPAKLIQPFPNWRFHPVSADIKSELNNSLKFHLERKKQKYQTRQMPDWWWPLYDRISLSMYQSAYSKAKRKLARLKPRAVALWNGHRLPESAYIRAAKEAGCKVFFFENGLLPNTTTLDPQGVNDLNILPRNQAFYRAYNSQHKELTCQSLHRELTVRENHKKRRTEKIKWAGYIPENYVFIPFQVNFDSQVLINSPEIRSMHNLYEFIDRVSQKRPDHYFLIKEHPSDPRVYEELHQRNPRILFVNENTEHLIRNASCIITLNSSVGLEALLFEQPVIALGNSCYVNDGLARRMRTPEEVAKALETPDSLKPDRETLEGFIKYLENEYLVPTHWNHAEELHLQVLEKRLEDYLKQ